MGSKASGFDDKISDSGDKNFSKLLEKQTNHYITTRLYMFKSLKISSSNKITK